VHLYSFPTRRSSDLLKQPGYPVVSAYVDSSDGHLKLSQQQFFIGEGKDVGRQWQIPLNANFKAPKIMSDKEIDLGYYKNLRSEAGHPLRINVGNNSHFIVSMTRLCLMIFWLMLMNLIQLPNCNYCKTYVF